jgi:type I restriction enzyme S subunit
VGYPATDFANAPFEIIDGDRGKAYPKQGDFRESGHCLFLSATNVTKSGFDFATGQFVDETKDAQLRKGKLQRGDVVLTTRGTLGNVAYYDESVPFEHLRINSGMVILRCDRSKILPSFLYAFLRSDGFKAQVERMRSGVAQPQLPIRDMKRIELPVPTVRQQKNVVKTISPYDDLIENNRRRIVLLEEAARMLYREWFVHFRFPGHEHVKIIDGLPEGWTPRMLADLVDNVKDTVDPSDFSEGEIHIGLEHIPRRSFTLGDWEAAEGLASGKTRFEEGDILFCKIRPYFHKVGFTIRAGLASSDALVWRVKERDDWPLVVCATSSDHFVAVASKTVREGSKMPRADWNVLKKYSVPKPLDGLLGMFNDAILPIAAQCKALVLQSRALAQARDLLLPRLMNGEIAV